MFINIFIYYNCYYTDILSFFSLSDAVILQFNLMPEKMDQKHALIAPGGNMYKSVIIILTLLIGQSALWAEMRTWTDKKGNSIEAEFVNLIGGKVILKTAAEKQVKVPASGLSSADQEFLKNAIPPIIEINVNIDNERKKADEGYSYTRTAEKVKGKVTITKKNRDPSNKTFKAELFIFSKNIQTDAVAIIAKSDHRFSFTTEKKIMFTGDTGKTEHTIYDSYSNSGKTGTKYEGYLVIIEDDKGKILFTKGSRKLFEQRASQIKKEKKGSSLDFLNKD